MLSVTNRQINQLTQVRRKAHLEEVQEELEPLYRELVETSDSVPQFSAWFGAQIKQCQIYGITTSGNVKSYCTYVIHHFPEFPDAAKFDACRIILSNKKLEENDKIDKVNYRLLFLR